MDTRYLFKRPPDNYGGLINPIAGYLKQSSTYLSKKLGRDVPIKEVKSLLTKFNRTRNPIVKYHYRQDNGDKVILEDTLTDYINAVKENNEVIAPSFTSYLHPDVKPSIHANFMSTNIKRRKSHKHMAAMATQDNKKDLAYYHDTLQKTMKVFNNSLSGAYADKGTILYNPSAHYTLTSTTRTVTSIGNAVTESVVAGNLHFKDSNTVLNYITAILTNTDVKIVGSVISKYNIHTPTASEVMSFILNSSMYYWKDIEVEGKILEYLNTLAPEELAMIMYTNNLWYFKEYNSDLMRQIISEMIIKRRRNIDNPLDVINNAPNGVVNLVHHIYAHELKGLKIEYDKFDPDLLDLLASTTQNVVDVIFKYIGIIQTFLVTDVTPPTIAYIKDMLRDAIVLSDTDSTCGSYDKWVQWYFGKVIFTDDAIAVGASIMTITTQVIDHYIKLVVNKLNVPKDRVNLISMKNEYYWNIFTSTNASKHYFANVIVQEGNVFSKPKLELKGVHLIASSANKQIRDLGYDIINDIHSKVTNGEMIDISYYIKRVADLEREVIASIKAGSPDFFNLKKIKEAKSYKNEVERSPYLNHMLWESVFASKYGSPGDPPYMIITVPTVMDTPNRLKEYLADVNSTNKQVKDSLRDFLAKYNKTTVGTFSIPLIIAMEKGLPEEILDVIDIKRVVTTNFKILYMVLESIGFYSKVEYMLSESGY